MKIESKIEAAVERLFPMPDDIAKLASKLRSDLYNGPCYETPDGEPASCFDVDARQMDFAGMANKLRDWINDHVGECWYDIQCDECFVDEPRGEEIDGEWIEPCWEDYYHVETNDVWRYLLGSELANTI